MRHPSRGRRRRLAALAAAAALTVTTGLALGSSPTSARAETTAAQPWMNTTLTPDARATLLLKAMTVDQKMQQLTGSNPEMVPGLPQCYGARHVTGIPELSIPTLRITNGPVGVGQNDCVDSSLANSSSPWAAYSDSSSAKATALPSGTSVAASFDPNVAASFGNVVGTEMNHLGLHVFEAPGVNMARLPVLGRNFEYFGEDPYLSGTMAVSEIKAVQDQGLIAMAKHFVANEQETNRFTIRENVDAKTLHETYLLPFEMAVKDGGVGAVMCSYNYLNGYSACENKATLTDVLRGEWGFKGYVQSDFGAAYSTVNTMKAGMDLEMPTPTEWATDLLTSAMKSGDLKVSDLDQALARRYTQMFRFGIFDRPLTQTPIDYNADGETAREIGTQGSVLLQNNGALPLSRTVKNVVVMGKQSQVYAQQAVAGGSLVGKTMGAGGGSSDVVPASTVSPVAGLQNVLAKLGNTSATVHLVLVDDANATATIDGKSATFSDAVSQASGADAVVIMAGTISEEGADRTTYSDTSGTRAVDFGNNLDWYTSKPNTITTVGGKNPAKNSQTVAMIKSVMAASPAMKSKTTLVLKDTSGVSIDPALVGTAGPSILEAWFPGQQDGNIVGDLLFGVVNPSGKSPFTYPIAGKGFMDSIAKNQYPGVQVDGNQTVTYTEGTNIGYRWYQVNASGKCPTAADGTNPCVAFPFGHGLSYTDFKISDLTVTPTVSDGTHPLKVQFFVQNTGSVAGAEAPQVYVTLPASTGEAAQRLVGFDKVSLQPGQKKRVEVTIDPAASNHPLSVWDTSANAWRTPSGSFEVRVGDSSASTPLVETISVHTPGAKG